MEEESKKTLETCISPELIDLYDLEGKLVVVIDVFRATSVMVTALAEGVKEIIPFSDIRSCRAMKSRGYLIAGERGGEQIDGFDLGNSPLSYKGKAHAGKSLAMTTTNGTLTINKSLKAAEIIIGGFLNFSAVNEMIKTSGKSVLLHCAGWKGRPNLEDTLYAGAVVKALGDQFDLCDSSVMAADMFELKSSDIYEYLSASSHVKRLTKINANIAGDIKHCCTMDLYDKVPVYKDGILS